MSTTLPSLAVIIPAYNEEDKIKTVLESLLNQTIFPQQVIVVNNNSTDDTVTVAKSFATTFKRKKISFQVVSESIPGCGPARNKGTKCSAAKIFAFLDADCVADPNWIATIHRHFLTNNSVAITGKVIMADAPFLVRMLTALNWYQFYFWLGRLFFGFQFLGAGNYTIKRSAFIKAGGFDDTISDINHLEDIEFAARLSKHGEVRYEKALLVHTSYRRYANTAQAIPVFFERSKQLAKIYRKYVY